MEKSYQSSLGDVKGSSQQEEKKEEVNTEHNFNAFKPGDFRLEWMKMKNAETTEIMWENDKWDCTNVDCQDVKFPKKMLQCKVLGRELCFYSKHAIKDFKILQRMKLHGHVVEEMAFPFGFVIPGSTNTWDQMIEADVGNVMPAEQLSGNLIAETYFMTGNTVIAQQTYKIFYV